MFTARLVRPYWRWLVVVAFATIVQTAARLAAPWTLKIVLDSVIGSAPLPSLLSRWSATPIDVLDLAVVTTLVIAAVDAGSQYINAFYTAKVGQFVAHDLRQTVYAHLQRLIAS